MLNFSGKFPSRLVTVVSLREVTYDEKYATITTTGAGAAKVSLYSTSIFVKYTRDGC